MNKYFYLFFGAFALNFFWENLHSFLYAQYKGGEITEFILARAALADALIILALLAFFNFAPFLRRRPWLLIVFGIIISVLIEWWALGTGRWAYNEFMPIIPVINTGLTPTIQLGILAFLFFSGFFI